MCVCVCPAGIFCLLRTSFVIVLMSREWATHSIPTLILLGIFLYVDRVVRQELIFDSSALTSTVFVTHVLNICRSKIAHIDIDPSSSNAAAAAMTLLLQHGNQSSVPSSNDNAAVLVDSWWWQQQVVLSAYCIASTLLLLEIDISALSATMLLQCTPGASEASSLLPTTRQREEQQQHHPRQYSCLSNHCTKKSGLHISTIVLHCLFVGTLLQIPVTKQDFMVPWKIMLRSFLFLVLALGWTYSVGVYNTTSWQQQQQRQESMVMIIRRRTRSYPYFLHDGTLVVQPFTQCQLRFLVLLFLDSWFLVATGAAMTCIVVHNVSILFAHISSPSAAATAQRNFASTHTAASVEKKKQSVLPSSYSPACAAAAPVHSSGAAEAHDLDVMHQQRQYHRCQPNNSAAATLIESAAASAKDGDGDEDEMAAMFRLARQAAAGKMGEQI